MMKKPGMIKQGWIIAAIVILVIVVVLGAIYLLQQDNIKAAANAKRYTQQQLQEQLAERLFVSADLVSKWERGIRRPDYRTVTELGAIFGVGPETLIDRESMAVEELGDVLPANAGKSFLTDCINAVLGELPERERIVFMWRYNLFLDSKTIAAKLGKSDVSVRKMLSRTRKKLARFAGRYKNER